MKPENTSEEDIGVDRWIEGYEAGREAEKAEMFDAGYVPMPKTVEEIRDAWLSVYQIFIEMEWNRRCEEEDTFDCPLFRYQAEEIYQCLQEQGVKSEPPEGGEGG